MSTRWRQQSERGSAVSLWIICFIANRLGRKIARMLLLPITAYYLVTATEQRRASRDYLRRVLNCEPGWWEIGKHIHCFASTIVDRIYFVTDRVDRFNIEFTGEDLLGKYRVGNKGCLMLGSHIGSFDALRVLGLKHGQLPLKILMYPDQNMLVTRLIGQLNPQIAEAFIPLGELDTLVRVRNTIEEGGVVGILGDRVAEGERTAEYIFLDEKALFPLGPAILADVLQVPVILCFALYIGDNNYRVILEELPAMTGGSRKSRNARAEEWTKWYVERLEYYVKSAPYNWFNFYDFWDAKKEP